MRCSALVDFINPFYLAICSRKKLKLLQICKDILHFQNPGQRWALFSRKHRVIYRSVNAFQLTLWCEKEAILPNSCSLSTQAMNPDCLLFELRFTAPGSDLDSDTPATTYIIKHATTFDNLTGPAFEEGENVLLTEVDIIDSSLTPLPGGQEVLLHLRPERFVRGQLYYFAMKADDQAGNQSPMSNIATGLIQHCQIETTTPAGPSGARRENSQPFITIITVCSLLWAMVANLRM